jgi:hypothetical protein
MNRQALAPDEARAPASQPVPTAQLLSLIDNALAPAAELSIIVPTLNERYNIAAVIAAVSEALPGVAWEIIFVHSLAGCRRHGCRWPARRGRAAQDV